MSGPCFTHFQLNCPICFPTTTGGISQPQFPPPQPSTTTTSPPAIPAKAGGAAAGAGGGTTETPVTSSTPKPPAAAGVIFAVAPDGTTTPTTSVAGTVTTTTAAGSTLDAPLEPPQQSGTDEEKGKLTQKGKRIAVEFRPPKRIKKTIIDCLIAQQIFRRDLHLTNKFFNSGDVLAWALEPDDPAFRHIHDYVACGQEHGYGLKICSILRIMARARRLEDAAIDFKEDPDTRDKLSMMLWHGTHKTSITSILENGLRLPRNHGQMFGPGIYFADRISKCCQYCGRNKTGHVFFFLCDVLVGNIYESKTSINGINAPPTSTAEDGTIVQHDSVMGVGRNIPDANGNKLHDGSVWPLGATVTRPETNVWDPIYLNLNEYIVYNANQVRSKYLVKVKFTEEPYYENF